MPLLPALLGVQGRRHAHAGSWQPGPERKPGPLSSGDENRDLIANLHLYMPGQPKLVQMDSSREPERESCLSQWCSVHNESCWCLGSEFSPVSAD